MEKNKAKDNIPMKGKKPVSQKAQLEQIRKKNITILIIGSIVMVIMLATSVMNGMAKNQQLSVTMALDQYRMGSKALTSAVQSYAVTGEVQYKDDYYAEINEIQNRDKALAVLEEEGLEESEWAILKEIQGLSNGLVPLEEAAMVNVESGDLAAAQAAVFGHDYEDAVVKINDLTDTLISTVQGRLESFRNICE